MDRPIVDLPYQRALGLAIAVEVVAAAWLWLLRTQAPGLRRLLAVLPVILVNLCLPRLFSRQTALVTIILIAFNAWLSTFKVGVSCPERATPSCPP